MICKCCRGEYLHVYKIKWAYVSKQKNITKSAKWADPKPVRTVKKTTRKKKTTP